MQSTLLTIPFIVISACMVLAATYDLQEHRVPNWLVLCVLALGLTFTITGMATQTVLSSLGGIVLGLAVLLPLYGNGGMGAGDVKLMAAAGAILGPAATLLAAGGSMVFGAAIALAMGRRQQRRLLAAGATCADDRTLAKQRVPFAPAIGLAVVLVLAAQTFGFVSIISAGLIS